MSEQERFEQWMQTQAVMPGCDLKRGGGVYAWIIVQLAWEAWQAGQQGVSTDVDCDHPYNALISDFKQGREFTVGKHTAANAKHIRELLEDLTAAEAAASTAFETAVYSRAIDWAIWMLWWRASDFCMQQELLNELMHLERKVAHGCTDASCKECDQ